MERLEQAGYSTDFINGREKVAFELLDFLSVLEQSVSTHNFFAIAEEALIQTDDLTQLIQCACLVRQRMPGGIFYAAKFWAKILNLLDVEQLPKQTTDLINEQVKHLGLEYRLVKKDIANGKLVRHALSEFEDCDSLRFADSKLFENARRQKQKSLGYLRNADALLRRDPNTSTATIHRHWCTTHGGIKANLDIIKPSDWWAFSHPKWKQDEDFSGSIPGEIYANALYYFAPTDGVAVDAMAGSGMFKRVYDDREKWQKDLDFQLQIRLFDVQPRRNYIEQHDACNPLPLMADWIFLDPPYYGQSSHLFTGILAQTEDYSEYILVMKNVLTAMTESLNSGGRLCLLLPKWSGQKLKDRNIDIPRDVQQICIELGLTWIDMAYVSRGRQQEAGSATKNVAAKRERRMRSDTCILNVFEK